MSDFGLERDILKMQVNGGNAVPVPVLQHSLTLKSEYFYSPGDLFVLLYS
jgi:hypothetical protein